jgi:hypothetical protein
LTAGSNSELKGTVAAVTGYSHIRQIIAWMKAD